MAGHQLFSASLRRTLSVFVSTLFLSGCPLNDDDNSNTTSSGGGTPTAVARIEISPSSALISEKGKTKALKAKAYDANGKPVAASVSWTTSHPDQIAIDTGGNVTSLVTNGSAVVVAEANGIKSPPALIVATEPAAGALAVTDDQVIVDPVAVDPTAVRSLNNPYEVVVRMPVPPPVGSILYSSESKPIAGRVLATEPVGENIKVTLKLIPINEMFPNLQIDEVIDASSVTPNFPSDVQENYDIDRSGNTYSFTPKPNTNPNVNSASARARPLAGSTGPFSCDASLLAFSNNGLDAPWELTVNPELIIETHPTLTLRLNGFSGRNTVIVEDQPKFTAKGGITLKVAASGKISCQLEFLSIPLPITGLWGLIFGMDMPLGLQLDVGGSIPIADVGQRAEVIASGHYRFGIDCPTLSTCDGIAELPSLTLDSDPGVAFDMPSSWDTVKVEPTVFLGGYLKVEVGPHGIPSLNVSFLESESGAKFEGNFMSLAGQINDSNYKSDYKIKLESQLTAGLGLPEALQNWGLPSIVGPTLERTHELGRSPQGSLIGQKDDGFEGDGVFFAGESAKFILKLDPRYAHLIYSPLQIGYNIGQVQLWRKVLGQPPVLVAQQNPSLAGQTDFTFNYTMPTTGTASEPNIGSVAEFYASTYTSKVPTGSLQIFPLELAQAFPKNPLEWGAEIHSSSSRCDALKIFSVKYDGKPFYLSTFLHSQRFNFTVVNFAWSHALDPSDFSGLARQTPCVPLDGVSVMLTSPLGPLLNDTISLNLDCKSAVASNSIQRAYAPIPPVTQDVISISFGVPGSDFTLHPSGGNDRHCGG
jgi:hypothetical protein